MQLKTSAGKHATENKGGKTCNHRQARGNIQPMASAGKNVTEDKRGKTCN